MRQVLPMIGYAIFAPLGPLAGALGSLGGAILGNLIDPVRVQGPDLGEATTQTATEGAARNIVYGRALVAGNLIDNGRLREVEEEQEQGKGGGPTVTQKRRYRTYAIRISEGPIDGVSMIKRRGKVIYDVRPGSQMLAESAQFAKGFRLYLGGEDQLPDPSLEEIHGVGTTPSYRGSAYIVFIDDDVTENGGAAWDHEFEVVAVGTTSDQAVVPAQQYFSHGVTGGTFSNRLNTHEWKAPAYTIMRARAQQNPANSDPTKYRLLANGQVIWDSGWMGDVSRQAALDSELAVANSLYRNFEYNGTQTNTTDPDAIRAFVGEIEGPVTGLTSITDVIVIPQNTNEIVVQQIRPDSDAYDVGSILRLDRLDPTVITEPYTALPELPGVVVGQSGTTYFTAFYDGTPQTLAPGTTTLAGIVTDICARCGIAASKIDVSQLTDTVRGFVLAGAYTGAAAINALRKVFFFDVSEWDGKIRFVKRGGAVKGVINESDLLDVAQDFKLENERQYPRAMHLQYQNPAANYNPAMESSQRESADVRVTGERSERTAVVLSADEAATVVHKLHNVAFSEAEGEVQFSLGDDFIGITPTDCYTYNVGTKPRRVMVTKVEILPGELKITAQADRANDYQAVVTGNEPAPPSRPPSSLAGPTIFLPLNIPALIDSHDVLGHYYAGRGVLAGWQGYALQRRIGAGDYVTLTQETTGAVMGYLTEALPLASEFYTDTTNTLRVFLHGGATLSSLTEEAFLSEGGAIAIGKPDGTAELLQYKTAVNEGGGVWALTTLLRGRLATAPAAHDVGAPFVLLSTVRLATIESAQIGQSISLRPVSLGGLPEQSLEYALALSPPVMQQEFPPHDLQATRSGANVITATVVPRHRFGNDLAPVASVNFQGFRWTLAGSSTVVVDTTTPALTYDASALGASVTLSVAQLNRFTGPGPAISRTV